MANLNVKNYKVKNWNASFNYTGKAAVKKDLSGKPSDVYGFDKGTFKYLFSITTKGMDLGIVSGKGVTMVDPNGATHTFYLVALKTPVNGNTYGYVSIQEWYFLTVTPVKDDKSKSQRLLNSLIENDKALFTKCNDMANLIIKCKAKGIPVSEEIKKGLIDVYVKLQGRQIALQSCPFLKIQKTKDVKAVAGTDSIGILPLIVWGIAVGAVALAGWLLYQWLKPEYDASKAHSEYLDKNEAELRKALGDKKFDELKSNVNTEIKDNAQEAYGAGKWDDKRSLIKNAALIGIGIFAFSQFNKHSSKQAA